MCFTMAIESSGGKVWFSSWKIMRFHLNFMINLYFQIIMFVAFMICFGYYCKGVLGWEEKGEMRGL